MSKKSSNVQQRRSGDNKNLPCKECGGLVINLDSNCVAVTCWRCVSKQINPNSLIVSDFEQEDWQDFLKKKIFNNHGRSENTTTES